MLWELYRNWVYQQSEVRAGENMADLLMFYEAFKQLLEICFVMHTRQADKD